MIRVYHVDVVKIRGSRLVSHVYHVFKRQVPNGESLKLGITGFYSALVVVIELRNTCGHLSASRSGRGDHHKPARRFDVVVFAQPRLGDNSVYIVWIVGDGIMTVSFYSQFFLAFFRIFSPISARRTRQAYAADIQSHFAEGVDES